MDTINPFFTDNIVSPICCLINIYHDAFTLICHQLHCIQSYFSSSKVQLSLKSNFRRELIRCSWLTVVVYTKYGKIMTCDLLHFCIFHIRVLVLFFFNSVIFYGSFKIALIKSENMFFVDLKCFYNCATLGYRN